MRLVQVYVVPIANLRGWAEAVAGLAVAGPLPSRVVLVPSEAHAHALRVELVARAPDVLAGTRFLTPGAAARGVLDEAGVTYRAGEEVRRPLRLRKVFRARPKLEELRAEDLASAGWEEAFASTIEQLEAAALGPETLEALDDARARDLAKIWRALDADAGPSWTLSRVLREAHAVVAADPRAWPYPGPVLAGIPASVPLVHARFALALPRVTLGVMSGRPARRRVVERARALLGDRAAALIGTGPGYGPSPATELGVLAAMLFEPPERIAAAGRPRSAGPDGTVALEAYAGVDEELDAAARWVAHEVFDHQTPLQEIAVLVPNAEPWAALVGDRLAALPWPDGTSPVHLACGRPATATAGGARLIALLRALLDYLPASAMTELIPRFRLDGADGHLTPGGARELVTALGTRGGSRHRPDDLSQWRHLLGDPGLSERLRPALPAVDALVSLGEQVVRGVRLAALWRAVREFVTSHLIAPRGLDEILELLDRELRALAADPVGEELAGAEAIELMIVRLGALRLIDGRYGDPSIFVGTIVEAAGLPFSAVRVLGLAEGIFPGTLREDPLLPAELRRRLSMHALPGAEDYAAGRLHAFDRVIRGVGGRLALSAPRTDVEGGERAPASLFVEVAAALARPGAMAAPANADGPRPSSGHVPTTAELERDGFRPARAASVRRRAEAPLTAICWLEEIARGRRELPSAWGRDPVTDPVELEDRVGGLEGVLGPGPLHVRPPGLAPDLPLSASALRDLLACPQRFLLQRMLGFRPRREPPPGDQLDPMTYGTLFHEIAETFAREHGTAFGARERDLAHWLAVADALACDRFEVLVKRYPLYGQSVIDSERRRVRGDVRTFIVHDWDEGQPRGFVATERAFGEGEGVALSTTAGPLYVAGRIDRIDVSGDARTTLVRDLKTGRASPRERALEAPHVDLDLQLAIYLLVIERLAADWRLPAELAAAYVYVERFATTRERSFGHDARDLAAAGRRWLDLAGSLLHEQAFIRTPDPADCRWCAFSPVCDDRSASEAAHLRDPSSAVAGLVALKEARARRS